MLKSEAISHFGSQQKLAAALGIRQASVSDWGDLVPLQRALKLQHLTAGLLRVDMSVYDQADAQRRNRQQSSA